MVDFRRGPGRPSSRERLHALLAARGKAGTAESLERKRLVREAEREPELDFGNDATGGAMVGGALGSLAGPSAGMKGAGIGAAVGLVSGMSKAIKQRKKEGQGSFEATWRTLGDVGHWIPDFGTASRAAQMLSTAGAGAKRRGEVGAGSGYQQDYGVSPMAGGQRSGFDRMDWDDQSIIPGEDRRPGKYWDM